MANVILLTLYFQLRKGIFAKSVTALSMLIMILRNCLTERTDHVDIQDAKPPFWAQPCTGCKSFSVDIDSFDRLHVYIRYPPF